MGIKEIIAKFAAAYFVTSCAAIVMFEYMGWITLDVAIAQLIRLTIPLEFEILMAMPNILGVIGAFIVIWATER